MEINLYSIKTADYLFIAQKNQVIWCIELSIVKKITTQLPLPIVEECKSRFAQISAPSAARGFKILASKGIEILDALEPYDPKKIDIIRKEYPESNKYVSTYVEDDEKDQISSLKWTHKFENLTDVYAEIIILGLEEV